MLAASCSPGSTTGRISGKAIRPGIYGESAQNSNLTLNPRPFLQLQAFDPPKILAVARNQRRVAGDGLCGDQAGLRAYGEGLR